MLEKAGGSRMGDSCSDRADSSGEGSLPARQSASTDAKIGGFWRRIFALLIDAVLLAGVGIAIGTLAFRQVVGLGQEGRLVGATIALAYFGVLNSRWGGGATLGKRLLGLKVISRDGKAIGFPRCTLRTIVFWTPYYLNGLVITLPHASGLPTGSTTIAIDILLALAVFGGGGFIVFLYLFNRRTRQTLHDLAAGTFVVHAGAPRSGVLAQMWKGHLVFAGLACALVASVPVGIGLYAYHSNLAKLLDQTTAVRAAALAYPGADTAQVSVNTTWFRSANAPATTRTFLLVAVRLHNIPASMEAAQDDIANIVFKSAPTILGQQALQVRVAYGYDLGIFSWTFASGYAGTPEDWARRIQARQAGVSA
jgi:uncharacterized RDD family membrane protein YckC